MSAARPMGSSLETMGQCVQAQPIRLMDAGELAIPTGGTPCFAKLNRLAWTGGFSFTSFGIDITVRSNSRCVLDRMRAVLPPGATAFTGDTVDWVFSVWSPMARAGAADNRVREFTLLYLNDGLLARDVDANGVIDRFAHEVQIGVATRCRDRVFVHAGVIAWQGKALVVPGASGTGKSELVRALLRLGVTYYSDEYAILTTDADVQPYRRPLTLRRPGGSQRERWSPIDAGEGDEPLAVGLVIFTRFVAGARFKPRRMPSAQAALTVIQNAVAARVSPALVMRAASELSRSVPAVQTPRGEAARVAPLILDALEQACELDRGRDRAVGKCVFNEGGRR